MDTIKNVLRCVLAAIMLYAGVAHFRNPEPFAEIVPNYLPAHRELVLISGFFEILGGVGLLVPPTRRAAAWGLIALYLAVFPANVNMAVHDVPINGRHFAPWLLWLRLPLQAVLIAWAYWYTHKEKKG
jgi:uncharacterized membrane protein